MALRKIADLNTPDLLLCEKMPGGLKLSSGINRSELVGFANTYGYLLPPDKMLPHLPGKSVPPLETDKARWDAWVMILCAAQGRAIMRARFVGDGFTEIPGYGQRGRWSYRGDGFTPANVAESYRNWCDLAVPAPRGEVGLTGTSHRSSWMHAAGTLFIHSETDADNTIEIMLNIRDEGGGLHPEIARLRAGHATKRRDFPDTLPGMLTEMLVAETDWALTEDPFVALEQMHRWADEAGDLLWRALTEIGELA